jgi:hypothetical protein
MTVFNKEIAHAVAETIVRSYSEIEHAVGKRHPHYWLENGCEPAIRTMQDNHHALSDEGKNGWAGKWSEVLKMLYQEPSKFSERVAQLIFTCNQMENALFNSGEFEHAEYVQRVKKDLWMARHDSLEVEPQP